MVLCCTFVNAKALQTSCCNLIFNQHLVLVLTINVLTLCKFEGVYAEITGTLNLVQIIQQPKTEEKKSKK